MHTLCRPLMMPNGQTALPWAVLFPTFLIHIPSSGPSSTSSSILFKLMTLLPTLLSKIKATRKEVPETLTTTCVQLPIPEPIFLPFHITVDHDYLSKKVDLGDFPGGLVARTAHSHCRGSGFDLWSGN